MSHQRVKEDLGDTTICLKQKKQALETVDMVLHLKKSLLVDKGRKRSNDVKHLEDDLKAVQNILKYTETNL